MGNEWPKSPELLVKEASENYKRLLKDYFRQQLNAGKTFEDLEKAKYPKGGEFGDAQKKFNELVGYGESEAKLHDEVIEELRAEEAK